MVHCMSARKSALRTQYGLTYETYLELFDEQGHSCAICKRAVKPHSPDIIDTGCVDHCHDTGKVRGILCFDCNVGLGKFFDKPDALRAAANYLEATNDRI